MLRYQDTKNLLALTGVEVLPDIGSVPFGALLEIPATIMWEHQGICPCGRKTYLFGQCPRCLKEEHEQRTLATVNEDLDQKPEEPDPVEHEVGAGIVLPDVLPMPVIQRGVDAACPVSHRQDAESACGAGVKVGWNLQAPSVGERQGVSLSQL